jgi:hypothetical protein
MAKVDAAVTDTHALLYHAAGRGLGAAAAGIYSAADAWRPIIWTTVVDDASAGVLAYGAG